MNYFIITTDAITNPHYSFTKTSDINFVLFQSIESKILRQLCNERSSLERFFYAMYIRINQFSLIPPIKIFFMNICTTVISFSSTKVDYLV